ncbi:lanthionine synthetase C family protein [Streptomyces olivaceoviridis]
MPTVIPAAVTAAALTAADDLARMLSDPNTVPQLGHQSQSLAHGATGIALLHIERARAGRGDWATAHTWLAFALRGQVHAGVYANLFHGVPALAFVTHRAATGADRYQPVLSRLDAATITVTQTRLAEAHRRMNRGANPELGEFDVLRGLSGLAAYHLSRHPDHQITRDILSCLVRETEPLPSAPAEVPPWWTRSAPDGSPSVEYPHGHGNLGMSHGIGSVLSVLSLALLRGQGVPGAADAVRRLCAWTDEWRQGDLAAPWWPAVVTSGHPAGDLPPTGMRRPRPSWCYGVAGMARAQQLAGRALGDAARVSTAENALLAALRDPVQVDEVSGIGLCHGLAGLLQSALRMARETGSEAIAAALPHLAERLVTTAVRGGHGPDFLEGSAGAALALYTFASSGGASPHWDSCLALA